MKCVILAAGTGSRINKATGKNMPKPLYRLFDRPLIEHVINNLKISGIRDFVIVVGFMADEIKRELKDGSRLGVRIEYAYNPEYTKPLGLSVLSAKEYVKGEKQFILSMSDHIIEPLGVKKLVDFSLLENACALLVDHKVDNIFWLDDAAKVKLDGGLIRGISKKYDEYDAIDCGVFKFSQEIFEAIARHTEHPDSISSAISEYQEEDRMFAVDIGEYLWIDIDEYDELLAADRIFKNILNIKT